MASRAKDAYVRSIDTELGHYPGVELKGIKLRDGGHRQATLSYNGQERFIVFPNSGGDSQRGHKNMVRDLRKELETLGAERVNVLPMGKRELKSLVAPPGGKVRMGIGTNGLVFVIPEDSKLCQRFGEYRWKVEVRSNPDLNAKPFVALVRASSTKTDTRARVNGEAKGAHSKAARGWQIMFQSKKVPGLNKIGKMRTAPIELVEDHGNTLVFRLPEVIHAPRGHEEAGPSHEPEVTAKVPEATPAPVAAPQEAPTAPVTLDPKRPMVLQLPQRELSIGKCIDFLNRQKDLMGSDLRFTITEGGKLRCIASFGVR